MKKQFVSILAAITILCKVEKGDGILAVCWSLFSFSCSFLGELS